MDYQSNESDDVFLLILYIIINNMSSQIKHCYTSVHHHGDKTVVAYVIQRFFGVFFPTPNLIYLNQQQNDEISENARDKARRVENVIIIVLYTI